MDTTRASKKKVKRRNMCHKKTKRNLGSLPAKREALNCVTVILNTFSTVHSVNTQTFAPKNRITLPAISAE